MYSRDKTAALHLPLQILLILGACICSLAVHFAAEGLVPVAGGSGYDQASPGGVAYQVDEQGEDNIILPVLTRLPIEHPAAPLQFAVAIEARSFPISPLLPPPNS